MRTLTYWDPGAVLIASLNSINPAPGD